MSLPPPVGQPQQSIFFCFWFFCLFVCFVLFCFVCNMLWYCWSIDYSFLTHSGIEKGQIATVFCSVHSLPFRFPFQHPVPQCTRKGWIKMICLSRAVVSLTVQGGQEFHFPHFFPQISIIFHYFSSNFTHFLPYFGPRGNTLPGSVIIFCNHNGPQHFKHTIDRT